MSVTDGTSINVDIDGAIDCMYFVVGERVLSTTLSFVEMELFTEEASLKVLVRETVVSIDLVSLMFVLET